MSDEEIFQQASLSRSNDVDWAEGRGRSSKNSSGQRRPCQAAARPDLDNLRVADDMGAKALRLEYNHGCRALTSGTRTPYEIQTQLGAGGTDDGLHDDDCQGRQ
jgi:hypothetical protein